MEELIRNIVEADKKARSNVAAKKMEKNSVADMIQDQKDDIKARYQEETKRCVAQKRAELEEELSLQQKQEQENYEKALAGLEEHFKQQKEEWVKAIVEKCLNA